MESNPRNFVSFFISFFSSQASDPSEGEVLVRKMLINKKVQEIIVKAMYKLESILTDSLASIRNPSTSKTSTNPVRQTRLLVLAKDIKQQMENYSMLQAKLDSVKDLVDTLNDSIEPVTSSNNPNPRPTDDLVNFLSAIAGKSRVSNFEIEEISDNAWTKHMEVEKMLRVEMEKYYNHLDSLETRHLARLNAVKFKTAKKIGSLEDELQRTFQFYRLMVDQASMALEDKLSKENEIASAEQKVLDSNTGNEMPVKDFNTAVAKIKNLFTVRKILEKRKVQDEKLLNGLNSKISILNQKISELVNTNLKLIENCSSLSWCLEFIFNRSEMPEAVKAKALKLLEKQKCAKLEGLFKIDNILETYSVETVSKRFQELKQGLASVSSSLKDENAKIRLSKLINESKLDEIDKTQVLKNIQPAGSTVSVLKPKSKSSSRKESTTPKEAPKVSALERMRKAMMSIDEELKETDKMIEDILDETHHQSNSSIFENTKEKVPKVKMISNKNITKASISPKSMKSNVRTEGSSYLLEDVQRDNKETQIVIRTETRETQISLKIFEVVGNIAKSRQSPSKSNESLTENDLERFIVESCKSRIVKRTDKSFQTDKEPGIFEFAAPSASMIRGIMNKIKNPKSDKSIKYKEPIDPNVADNLIIRKMRKPQEDSVFKTEISEIMEEVIDSKEAKDLKDLKDLTDFKDLKDIKDLKDLKELKELKDFKDFIPPHVLISTPVPTKESSIKAISKQGNLTLPLPSFSNLLSNFSKVTTSSLTRVSKTSVARPVIDDIELANEHYKKEFSLHAQLKGLKKMNFEDIQKVWEEVINRRILEGENDKISIYLRGYLGTDKYESEKEKVISYMQSQTGYIKKLSPLRVNKEKVLANWKKIMTRLYEKLAFTFKSRLSPKDSPREVLFKIAKTLKFIKHRLPHYTVRSTSMNKKLPEPLISYSTDKWSLNSTSVSPMESLNRGSRHKFIKKNKGYPRLMAKTPIREKFNLTESGKLPLI